VDISVKFLKVVGTVKSYRQETDCIGVGYGCVSEGSKKLIGFVMKVTQVFVGEGVVIGIVSEIEMFIGNDSLKHNHIPPLYNLFLACTI
jgi:hypothetical protein